MFLTALLFVLVSTEAMAGLRSFPEITKIAVDPQNLNNVYLRIDDLPIKAAIGDDGGRSFSVAAKAEIPTGWTTDINNGEQRYVLIDSSNLIRSEDAGISWKKTAALDFIRTQIDFEIEKEKENYQKKYEILIPKRSELWNPVFGMFAIVYFVIAIILLRTQNMRDALLASLRGVAIILIVWIFLSLFHCSVLQWFDSKYPMAYWNTNIYPPHQSLGIAMSIAALPIPLLVYLLVLFPILPGIAESLTKSASIVRRRIGLFVVASTSIIYIVFHLYMISVGQSW